MLLTSMKLVNVGIFKGVNKFDFKVEPNKPIVLYGGSNGAGKTTLFEGISLCLYGKNFDRKKNSKKRYHEKIYRLFHKNKKTRIAARDASITLEFDYAQNGTTTQYQITRLWQNNDGKIEEFLTMNKKSKSDKKFIKIAIDELQIQDIINQMIPKDIASMFFFDGEQIQNIAQIGNENTYIKSSFDTLLGLDLPNQLYDDIGLYILRNSNDEANTVLVEIEHKTREKEKIEKRLDTIKEKRVFLESEISNSHKELDLKEQKFFKMGGRYVQQRQRLVNEKLKYEKNMLVIENNLQHIVEKELPLVLVSDQLEQVKKELESDKKRIQQSFEKDTLCAAFSDLKKTFVPLLESHDVKTQKDITKKLEHVIEIKLGSLSDKQKLTFDFSLDDMDLLLAQIDPLVKNSRPIKIHHKAHVDINKKLGIINTQLDVAPKQDESGPIYSEIKAITMVVSQMEQELLTLQRLETQEKSMIMSINTSIRKHLKKKKLYQRNSQGLEMAPKIQDALEDYSQKLRMQKIKLLESNILKGIQTCFHKEHMITKIVIDPDTYKVTLYQDDDDNDEYEITKEQLSKGELQMYATAIVWGLAKTSGRPLPFIIDTPLARLDDKHRKNLIKNFYPVSSHQTIIFSTNTEIIESYFDALNPHISKAYLIEYDANKDSSLVVDGYFKDRKKGDKRIEF